MTLRSPITIDTVGPVASSARLWRTHGELRLTVVVKATFDLVHDARSVHRENHDSRAIQWSTLLSIKTGGCPEDCGYCSQSAHFDTPLGRPATGLGRTSLMDCGTVTAAARDARMSRNKMCPNRRNRAGVIELLVVTG